MTELLCQYDTLSHHFNRFFVIGEEGRFEVSSVGLVARFLKINIELG